MNVGLPAALLEELGTIFQRYPEIEQVLLFGSRARGDFRLGSDLDLAIRAPAMSEARFIELWGELDALPSVYKMDILHWDALHHPHLKQIILAEGLPIYPVPPRGWASPATV